MSTKELSERAEEFLHRIVTGYERIFAIDEIRREPILQWVFGAMLLFFFITFARWMPLNIATKEVAESGTAVCWPYFQNCADLFFLHSPSVGYSQTIFYMGLYAVMALIVYFIWRKEWRAAHALMVPLLIWEMLYVLVFEYAQNGPYYYYHIALTMTLLFATHKEFFLKLVFVMLYFLSATIKIDSTWILGSYFTSLKYGLPIFPTAIAPLVTNFVIFMQMVGAWFLMSRNEMLQRTSLIFFATFHLYSGIFVWYFYPTIALPPLLILFGPMYRHTRIPFDWKATTGWVIVALLVIFQALGFVVPADRRLTLEGNRYGMFMFEANHQCIATITTHFTTKRSSENDFEAAPGSDCGEMYCLVQRSTKQTSTGSAVSLRYESATAWNRCDPYEWWSRLHTQCGESLAIRRIEMQFDHSINGGPFYRMIDAPNICDLDYRPFVHNEWIKVPPEAPIMGYPVQNIYSL